jgi:hypothetical protein
MSEFAITKTCIKDKGVLIESLVELGVPQEHIEVCEIPQNLEGFQGDRRNQTADIIIRRQYVGSASNDLGWKVQADGTYSLIISNFDKSNPFWRKMIPQSAGGSGDLLKTYSKNVLKKVASKSFHRITKCENKEKIMQIEITI